MRAQLLAKGKVHADLHWRHVAWLPSKERDACQIAPILIDITRLHNATEADQKLADAWLQTPPAQRHSIPAVEQQIRKLQSSLSTRLEAKLRPKQHESAPRLT